MRKEYIPAIVLYVVSALLYVAAVVLLFLHSHHWATFLIFGVAVMLFASSKLVNIGKKLREEEEWSEKQDE
jgi:uncharacterized membrane-anchored protein YitT (DUF2179 family)